ncbi:MAG: SPOR domain-containing protein, partial [Kiloniellales bacterium]
SQDRASSVLRETAAKFSDALSQTQGFVAPVDLGEQGVLYRVIAGELPSREAAITLCRRLRAKAPATFCKVLAN